jgi:hypothetical protein
LLSEKEYGNTAVLQAKLIAVAREEFGGISIHRSIGQKKRRSRWRQAAERTEKSIS